MSVRIQAVRDAHAADNMDAVVETAEAVINQIVSSTASPLAGNEIQIASDGSTVNGVLIGLLSSFGSAILIALIFIIVYFFKYTAGGRILLDRLGHPGEYDDEQAFLREEAEALEEMDEMQRVEYLRAKAFVQANPPESLPTDISLSQYLAIQEKGVSAWEFEPELEIANCFVEGRTEIEFFDSECCVMSNLPVPKQNEVYYWEAKIYDKPEGTLISIGMATKPYPLFRLPGWHKYSVAYLSTGHRRYNQPFAPTTYGPTYVQGDVIGVGYRPRTGTIFFTRNGKKLDDVAHNLKSQNLFPAVGANGPCQVHVNFGQSGFVFIEANVKKWGLAPMTGSLAPPPPYGSEQGSILLESGREGVSQSSYDHQRHGRTRSGNNFRFGVGHPTSPGPVRSPTDISLAHLVHIPSNEDVGEGTSHSAGGAMPQTPTRRGSIPIVHTSAPSQSNVTAPPVLHQQDGTASSAAAAGNSSTSGLGLTMALDENHLNPPPEYTSPESSRRGSGSSAGDDDDQQDRYEDERTRLIQSSRSGSGRWTRHHRPRPGSPPIPSYDDVVAETQSQAGSVMGDEDYEERIGAVDEDEDDEEGSS